MERLFAPGCAFNIYKPHLVQKLTQFLNSEEKTQCTLLCCHNNPEHGKDGVLKVITVCSGCTRRYSKMSEKYEPETLWELLDKTDSFEYPDYSCAKITVHDTCPTRNNTNIHAAVRSLLKKMNFEIIETKNHGVNAVCCGDTYHGKVSKEELYEKMKKRADEMPVTDVAVYCVSCIKSLKNGGKKPRYLVDLLFNEQTEPGECDPDLWHESVAKFANEH